MFLGVHVLAEDNLVGNSIEHHPEIGHFMNVFDHPPQTLEFMQNNELQGGGPTWMGLITAALNIESPSTLGQISFDDEADGVLVTSDSDSHLMVVQSYVSLLMSDEAFMAQCITRAQTDGSLE